MYVSLVNSVIDSLYFNGNGSEAKTERWIIITTVRLHKHPFGWGKRTSSTSSNGMESNEIDFDIHKSLCVSEEDYYHLLI